ncbi:apolipoprotein N-acyltransferase [Acetobacter sp. AN02]|uniref:apolipoprotein N-acyltransferase n=1 Tax=Acetobacter sp. AN02 TaxID=2894186 RepID=UPI00243446D0|nr:apolipoprotein N-acyltransferase [Acetobacter sp. AN02]MDG6094058.1 apolipoprotein N-acyltransferase [Acetobacter sp. AN02]
MISRDVRPLSVWRRIVWPSLMAGGLAAFAFPPLHLVPVLLLAFPLWLRVLDRSRSWKEAGLSGFLFGFALHTLGLYWLTNAILIRAAEFWWLVPFASPACAVILGPYAAVPAILCRLALPGWRRILVLAGAWTLADMSRLYLFSGFPWNPMGSDWAFHGGVGDVMIQPAAWIGVDGLTLLTVCLALFAVRGRVQAVLCSAVLVVWAVAGVVRLQQTASLPPVADQPVVVLVQGNVSEDEKLRAADVRDVFRRYLRLTHEGVEKALAESGGRPVVYLWPETSFPGVLDQVPVARSMIAQAGSGAAAGLVGTLRGGADGHWRNSMAVLLPDGSVAAEYDKSRLVPFGEYQPAFIPIQVVPGGGLKPGGGAVSLRVPGVSSFGPLICYEVIFTGHVTDHADRPHWLANITNDAWYGNSAGPRQHLAAARLRAVEEGMPVARAANTGISIVYDSRGHELARLPWGISGSLTQPLPPPLRWTIFGRFGQTVPFVLALSFLLFGFFGKEYVPARRNRQDNCG